jgi:hypothetical protein
MLLAGLAFLGYAICPLPANTAYHGHFMPKPKKYPTKLLIGLADQQLAMLDRWRREQDDLPTRSEAIRRLVEAGLEALNAPKSGSIQLKG